MEWISVKDKRPEVNTKVLAYDTGRIYICYRRDEEDYNEHWAICEDQNCSCIGCTGAITRWMPLPKMPSINNMSEEIE